MHRLRPEENENTCNRPLLPAYTGKILLRNQVSGGIPEPGSAAIFR
jgi:hypothetical protein